MNKPLTSTALFAVLAHADWGGAETSTLAFIARTMEEVNAEPGGLIEVSHRDVSHGTGLGVRAAGKAIQRLVEKRVIEVAELGIGRQRTRYRINPNVGAWGVTWRDPALAAAAVDDVNQEEPEMAVARASGSARKAELARAPGRRAQRQNLRASQGARATENLRALPGARATETDRAVPGARANSSVARAPGARANPADDRRPLLVVSSSSNEELHKALSREQREEFDQIKTAIDARGEGEVVVESRCGGLIREALAAGLSVSDALEAIARAPGRYGPWLVAKQLLGLARGEPVTIALPSTPPTPAPEIRPDYRSIDEIRASERASLSGPPIDRSRLDEFWSARRAPIACQNGHKEA